MQEEQPTSAPPTQHTISAVARALNVPRATLALCLKRGIDPHRYPGLTASIAEYREREQIRKHDLLAIVGKGGTLKGVAKAVRISPFELQHYLNTGTVPAHAPNLADRIDMHLATQSQTVTLSEEEEPTMLTKTTLPEEVLDYWKLTHDPFTNEINYPDDIYESDDLKRAERKIHNAIRRAIFVAIAGPVGSGKTTLLKRVEDKLASQREVVVVKPWLLEKQHLNASHVCEAILEDLGVASGRARSLEAKSRLVALSLQGAYGDGRKVALIIDEAHLLQPDVLRALKRIHEFESKYARLLSIILVGQPLLARQLRSNLALLEVGQRVDLYELREMSGNTASYIAHKLARAGAATPAKVFSAAAIKAIEGRRNVDTPLAVNNLAAAALIAAFEMGEESVSVDIINAVSPAR